MSGDEEAGTPKDGGPERRGGDPAHRDGGPERRGGRATGALLGAESGAVSGFAALAAAELVSAAVRPEAGPVTVVGGAAVDPTPPALKDFAVRHFQLGRDAIERRPVTIRRLQDDIAAWQAKSAATAHHDAA